SDAEAFFSAMATEVYTTLGYSQTQIVGVVDTAVSWNDDETTLPAETANTITCTGGGAGTTYALPSNAECTTACGANTCTCTAKQDNTGAGSWDATPYNYNNTLPATAEKTFDLALQTDFPGA